MDLTHVIAERENKKIYRDGAKAIKVFAEGYSKADILNEALNTARVEETGLPIPKLLAVDTVNGQWAITTEFVEGDTLAALMAAHPEKEDEYLNLFVDIQMKVHACTCPMLNSLTEKMQRKISATDLDATTRYELHTRLASMHVHKKVCHGDFNPSNIIVKDDGTAYIIDWAHATQGNASADAAMTYLLFALKDQKVADLYLKLFCKKSDTAMQYVQQWLPIVAAAQLSKENELEKDFLMRWIDVVDYQ